MDEMGQFYDHCLEALYPPGSCAFLLHHRRLPLSPHLGLLCLPYLSLRGVAAARSHQVDICATTTPLPVTWQKCRSLAVTRAGSTALKVSACGSQREEQDASALDCSRQVRLTLLPLRPCTQAKMSPKRVQSDARWSFLSSWRRAVITFWTIRSSTTLISRLSSAAA